MQSSCKNYLPINMKRKDPPTQPAGNAVREGGGRLPVGGRDSNGTRTPSADGLGSEATNHSFDKEKQRRYQRNIRGCESRIWLDGELVDRPSRGVVSYGILLYKVDDDDAHDSKYKYLLGLVPQGNAWTVFKGMPEDDGSETPEQTAMREFEEETSIPFPYPTFSSSNNCAGSEVKLTTLFGQTSNKKKLLEIYLVKAPADFSTAAFDKEKVVRIDSGYMKGKPEIIDIRFLTKRQAVEGTNLAGKVVKIYKSQVGILEHADVFLRARERREA